MLPWLAVTFTILGVGLGLLAAWLAVRIYRDAVGKPKKVTKPKVKPKAKPKPKA